MKLSISKDGKRMLCQPINNREATLLKEHFSPFIKDHMNNQRVRLGVWDGKVRFWNDGKLNIGLWKSLIDFCKENDFPIEIENKECFPINKEIKVETTTPFFDEFFKNHELPDGSPFRPYKHQIEAATSMLRRRYTCIEVATGGGKSLIFSMFLFYILKNLKPDARTLLIVPSLSLVTQFTNDLKEYINGYKEDYINPLAPQINITELMSDKPLVYEGGEENSNLIIGTYQSLSGRDKSYFQNFDVVVGDECHVSQNESMKYILSNCNKAIWKCGMSGTPYTQSGIQNAEWMQIQSLLGPVEYIIRAKELQELGIIAKLKITCLHLSHNSKEFGKTLTAIKSRGGGKQAFDLEKKFIQVSPKRLDFLVKLIEKTTRPTLVLYHTLEFGTAIYEACRERIPNKSIYYIDGEVNKEKRLYIKNEIENSTTLNPKVVIASYGTTSTGWSVKSISRIILADSFKEEKLIRQSIGRGLRLHKDKTELHLIDIVDIISDNMRKKGAIQKHGEAREQIYINQGWDYEIVKMDL